MKHSKQVWSGVPVMVANMDTTGTFEIAKALAEYQIITCLHKHYTVEEMLAFAKSCEGTDALKYVAVSAGTSTFDIEKISKVLEVASDIKMICLDVANGYSEHFASTVNRVRGQFPNHTIIAGNVVTGEMVEQLLLSGADIVKVGIGPGSVCTTRKQTGVGYPQLSAVLECADAAHGLNGHIVSDGGCACPGDFSKAFGAGADFVMAGGMFAGHHESGGTLVERNGKKFKQFYGMSSTTAMKKHDGKVAEYPASEGKATVPTAAPLNTPPKIFSAASGALAPTWGTLAEAEQRDLHSGHAAAQSRLCSKSGYESQAGCGGKRRRGQQQEAKDSVKEI